MSKKVPGSGKHKNASGFNLPITLDQNQWPGNAGGGPFFSGGLVPAAPEFQGQPYKGNPDYTFKQINFNKLNNLAIQSALLSQKAAQDAWAKRYPLLQKADELGITSNLLNISGKHDPFIYNALNQSGLGGYDFGSNPYLQAYNMGSKDLLSKEKRDRNYNATVFGNHPITRLGLGPKDVWAIAEANTGGLNAAAAGAGEDQNTLANAQAAANQQIGQSIIGGLGALAGTGIKAYTNSPYLNTGYYNQQYIGGGDPYGGSGSAGGF